MDILTSLQNPKIKDAHKLWERRDREKSQRFLIEGFRELSRAVGALVHIETLFVCPELFLGRHEAELIEQIALRQGNIYRCSEKVFAHLSYRDRPDGILAVARQTHLGLEALQGGDFYIVAEAIEKPGNLGTILRSADASGVQGMIVCDRCTDIHNPNVVRASVGTLFTLPVVEASSLETVAWLKKRGIAIVAATPHAQKVYTEVDLTGPVAIVVGTEQYGLSAQWMGAADLAVKIPMWGVADSLNVATATTLLLYEVVRQRKN